MTLALVLSLVLTAPAKSPPKPAPAAAPQEDPSTVQARELFQWGQRLYKQARYAEAIAKFEEAYAVRPHPVIYFNIGRCYEQLGETAKALRAYRDYLRLAPDAKDRETVADAMVNLERRLREKGVQQLMVFADPPNARIEVDGKDLGTSPASVELVAGNHTLAVRAEGHDTVERAFVMTTARATEMTIALRPSAKEPVVVATPPPPPPPVEPKKDEKPPEVKAPAEEQKAPTFHRFFVGARANAAIPPQAAGSTSIFASVLAGANLVPSVSLAAGVLITNPVGFLVQASWVPWNVDGRFKPVVSLELPLVLPSASQSLSFGAAVAPGARFDVTHWLSLGLDVPLTYFFVAPEGAPRFYVFVAGAATLRFL